MKFTLTGILAGAFLLTGLVHAQRIKGLDVNNRLRVEYDSNVNLTSEDEQDSFKIIEELELIKNLQFDQSLISLRYSPSFVYWTDRDDDTDLHHQFDALVKHRFNERFGFTASELFRLAELPEFIESGNVVREKSDFIYNSAGLGGNALINEKTTADVELRWNTLAYDDADVSLNNDYDQYIYGGNLRHDLNGKTQVGSEIRFTDYDYAGTGRDAFSTQFGVTGIRDLTARSKLSVRAGWENKDFDNANTDSASAPYVSASLTFAPGEDTLMEVGASYSLSDAPVDPYANSENSSFYARFSHDLSAKINWNVAGIFTVADYDSAETSVSADPDAIADGTEDVLRVSTKLTYQLNTLHALEANVQYTDLTSEIRPGLEYDRSRVSLGWRVQL